MRLIRYNGVFNEQEYLSSNPAVAASGINPVLHYLLYGRSQKLNPGKDFSNCFYIDTSSKPKYGIKALIPWIINRHHVFSTLPLNSLIRQLQKEMKIDGLAYRQIVPAQVKIQYNPSESNPSFEKEQIQFEGQASTKHIAFYLPQFHPFDDNDRFWGKGFTEWTNVTKALPLFPGHYQPKLPGELGFYDLRIGSVMQRQTELARRTGIYGFCLHHYYFEGKTLMRVPYEYLLKNKNLDFPFCIHWANESWSAKFDGWGRDGGMLIEQKHTSAHDLLFLKDIEPALKDERYIRIEGKPLLLVYRPGLFPNARETAEKWREYSRKMGFDDIFLVMAQTGFDTIQDPRIYGYDAAVEFPPHKVRHVSVRDKVNFYNPDFKGHIFNYSDVMAYSLSLRKPEYTLFRGIMPGWDNTARIREPYIYYDSSPEIYEKWLTGLNVWTQQNNPSSRQFIFINAWNEWAEGAYLEPDRQYGYGYLNATTRAMQNQQKTIEHGK